MNGIRKQDETVSLLTGKIRQHMEENKFHLHESLLSMYCPQLLRPSPAVTVIHCLPKRGALRETFFVARGEKFSSPPLGDEKTICHFRTTRAFSLQPLQVSQAKWEVTNTGSKIKIEISGDPGIALSQLKLQDLNLHLHMAWEEAVGFLKVLVHDVQVFRVGIFNDEKKIAWMGEVAVEQGGLECEDPTGGQLWREYFICPQKYLFAIFKGLEKIAWPARCTYFLLEASVPHEITDHFSIDETQLLINGVSVENLFTQHTEPFIRSSNKTEYPLILDLARPQSAELYCVDEVIGWDPKTTLKKQYYPLSQEDVRQLGDPYYVIARCENGNKISFVNDTYTEGETFSGSVTACQKDIPHHFLKQDHLSPVREELKRCLNIHVLHPPTKMFPPLAREHYAEQIVLLFALQYGGFGNLHHFKKFLSLQDITKNVDNRIKREGIRQLEIKNINRIHKGVYEQGIEVSITLDEACFLTEGDQYLFSVMARHFFASLLPIHIFIQMRVCTVSKKKCFLWKPLFGMKYRV